MRAICFLVKEVISSLRYLTADSQSQTFSSCSSTEMDGSISYEGSQTFRTLIVYIAYKLKLMVMISFWLVLYAD